MGKNSLKLIASIIAGMVFSPENFLVSQVLAETVAQATQVSPAARTINEPVERKPDMTEEVRDIAQDTVEIEAEIAEKPEVTTETSTLVGREEIMERVVESPAVTSEDVQVKAPAVVEPAPVSTSINVAGHTIPILESTDMADDSGNNVLRYNKLLRGHNSDQVFKVLYGMNSCDVSPNCTFSITENGKTRKYQIKERVEYTVESYATGKLSSSSGNTTMYSLVNKAKGHTYALFTCFGEYDTVIDRYKQVLVLYADAV